ncbi:protein of unknown function [Caballeronia arationis]|uniref:DUF4391 domain-containing protein n=1 Tax=Caballeronia arationis TaxID=1777142 RepID=A0A7Z7N400_9BURK|nr:DUF4391 domain-containing protein [Caballeronia arationis]SOE81310.1 protein of unknown function [Caballeronia arationis]
MTAVSLIAALDLPANSRVDQRVPKKLLVENGAPTTSDKRQINDGIEEAQWLAALKPNTIGVPAYRDDAREYLEIAILNVKLRGKPQASRLAELIHRAVPYPVVLLLDTEHGLLLSLVHKRWAQNEADKVVLDGELVEIQLSPDHPSSSTEEAFTSSIALRLQPQGSLYALYQGWMDSIEAFLASKISGTFTEAGGPEKKAARRVALHRCRELDLEIAALQRSAAKETQIARQVAANLKIKALREERLQAVENL